MKLLVGIVVVLVATSIEGRTVKAKSKKVVNEVCKKYCAQVIFYDRTISVDRYDKTRLETTLTPEDLLLGQQMFAVKKASRKTRETEEVFDATPMQNDGMFEGDIANKGLTSETIYRFLGEENPNAPQDNANMRNAIKGGYSRWPGATIPYTISTQYSAAAKAIIAEAMSQFAIQSCIKIVPRTNQADYIHIQPDSGCYSYVGRTGGKQIVSFGDGCVDRGIIMHELMHAVGFFHEQSRPDRDQYVEILNQNIMNGYADQFEKYTLAQVDYLGQPYDYLSVMHYAPTTFSKNGQETIRPVAAARAEGAKLGHRNDFSPIDINELNIIAQCADAGVTVAPAATTAAPAATTAAPAATTAKPAATTAAPAATTAAPAATTAAPAATTPVATAATAATTKAAGSCPDKAVTSDCQRLANQGYCTQATYASFMADQCPKTCKTPNPKC